MKDRMVWQSSAVLVGGLFSVWTNMEVRIWILAFFLLLMIRLWFLWKPVDFYGRLCRPEVLMLVCGLLVGLIYGFQAEKSIPTALIIDNIKIEGRLTDWNVEEKTARGVIKLDRAVYSDETSITENLGRKYTLKVYADSRGTIGECWLGIKPGDKVAFSAKLEHPKRPGTVGGFDLPLYNNVRGLSGSLTPSGEVVLVDKGVPSLPWIIRQQVRVMLDHHWENEAGVLEGILFGDSSRIPSETLHMYKAAGVVHVFAASGANVAFIIALFWAVLFFLPRKARITVTIGVIILYAFLCKGNPPILRATILGVAVLLGMLSHGKVSSLRWLLFAAIFLFLWNPLFLRDVSFQLSFAAAWGIVVLSPRLLESRIVQKFPMLIRRPAAVALSVQIAVLPFLVDVFQRVSLVGFITNIFILVILGTVLQLGIIGTSLIMLPVIPLVFFEVSFWLLAITDRILSFFASLPLAYLWVLNPGVYFWCIWYGLIAIELIGRQKVWFITRVQLRKLNRLLSVHISDRNNTVRCWNCKSLFPCIITIVLVLMLWTPWQSGEKLKVTFLDVGQGDCILIRTPKESFLIDTGPKTDTFDAGERIVVPYLMQHRVGYLDMLFITHEHADHIGGARYILTNIPTAKIAVPNVEERLLNEEWQASLLKNSPFDLEQLVKLRAGDILYFHSGLAIEVLSPRETLYLTPSDANNNSLVLLFKYLDKKILFTGDMEKEQMQALTDRGADWDADLIKIPHHGSRSSYETSWFDRTDPHAVFIQVGRNSFGHPSPEVLTYWETRGVPVYRNDIHGTIDVVLDKRGVMITPGRVLQHN